MSDELVITLHYMTDPGHGWLVVPFGLIRSLEIDVMKVSSYSYMNRRDGLAYLEEDCDAGILLEAADDAGVEVNIVTIHTNEQSPIRRLPAFVGVYEMDHRARSRPRVCDL